MMAIVHHLLLSLRLRLFLLSSSSYLLVGFRHALLLLRLRLVDHLGLVSFLFGSFAPSLSSRILPRCLVHLFLLCWLLFDNLSCHLCCGFISFLILLTLVVSAILLLFASGGVYRRLTLLLFLSCLRCFGCRLNLSGSLSSSLLFLLQLLLLILLLLGFFPKIHGDLALLRFRRGPLLFLRPLQLLILALQFFLLLPLPQLLGTLFLFFFLNFCGCTVLVGLLNALLHRLALLFLPSLLIEVLLPRSLPHLLNGELASEARDRSTFN